MRGDRVDDPHSQAERSPLVGNRWGLWQAGAAGHERADARGSRAKSSAAGRNPGTLGEHGGGVESVDLVGESRAEVYSARREEND